MTGRRSLLTGTAALVGPVALPAGAVSPARPNSDHLLLALASDLRDADAAFEAAAATQNAATSQGDAATIAAAQAATDEAWASWEAVMGRMAATPAAGLPGVAVKASQILRGLGDGRSVADTRLADSLAADLARLVPAVAS